MDVGQIIAIVVALIGLTAGGVGVTAKARQDSIVNALTKDNVATKDYNQTLEAEKARLLAERDSWKREADTFREHAQGSPQLTVLTTALKGYTKAVTDNNKLVRDYILGSKRGGRDAQNKSKAS